MALATTSSEGGIPGRMVRSQEPKASQTRWLDDYERTSRAARNCRELGTLELNDFVNDPVFLLLYNAPIITERAYTKPLVLTTPAR